MVIILFISLNRKPSIIIGQDSVHDEKCLKDNVYDWCSKGPAPPPIQTFSRTRPKTASVLFPPLNNCHILLCFCSYSISHAERLAIDNEICITWVSSRDQRKILFFAEHAFVFFQPKQIWLALFCHHFVCVEQALSIQPLLLSQHNSIPNSDISPTLVFCIVSYRSE